MRSGKKEIGPDTKVKRLNRDKDRSSSIRSNDWHDFAGLKCMLATLCKVTKGFLARCQMRKGKRVKAVQVWFDLAVGVTSLDEHARVLCSTKWQRSEEKNTQTCYDPLERNF